MRTSRAGVAVLQPVGTGISDWVDVLLDPDHADVSRLHFMARHGFHSFDDLWKIRLRSLARSLLLDTCEERSGQTVSEG